MFSSFTPPIQRLYIHHAFIFFFKSFSFILNIATRKSPIIYLQMCNIYATIWKGCPCLSCLFPVLLVHSAKNTLSFYLPFLTFSSSFCSKFTFSKNGGKQQMSSHFFHLPLSYHYLTSLITILRGRLMICLLGKSSFPFFNWIKEKINFFFFWDL